MRKLFPTIVVTLETWYWLCPRTWNSPLKMLFFKEVHSCPSQKLDLWVQNSIFENVFQIILLNQIWVLMTFWMSGSHQGHIFNILSMLEAIWGKNFFHFFENFCFTFKPFWLQNAAKLSEKFLKMSIFQKWSLKSKIRNGEGLRLYVNCLRRLWWP